MAILSEVEEGMFFFLTAATATSQKLQNVTP